MNAQQLQEAARAAKTAAGWFAERGQDTEAAVSALMAARYIEQLDDRRDRP